MTELEKQYSKIVSAAINLVGYCEQEGIGALPGELPQLIWELKTQIKTAQEEFLKTLAQEAQSLGFYGDQKNDN